jgi:hypothetical protein
MVGRRVKGERRAGPTNAEQLLGGGPVFWVLLEALGGEVEELGRPLLLVLERRRRLLRDYEDDLQSK